MSSFVMTAILINSTRYQVYRKRHLLANVVTVLKLSSPPPLLRRKNKKKMFQDMDLVNQWTKTDSSPLWDFYTCTQHVFWWFYLSKSKLLCAYQWGHEIRDSVIIIIIILKALYTICPFNSLRCFNFCSNLAGISKNFYKVTSLLLPLLKYLLRPFLVNNSFMSITTNSKIIYFTVISILNNFLLCFTQLEECY